MSFRQRVTDEFVKRFGNPEVSHSPLGPVYRWRLRREDHLDVHVIIDSPELEDQAHIIISDPCEHIVDGVRTMLLLRVDEVADALNGIEQQWRLEGCWARRAQEV